MSLDSIKKGDDVMVRSITGAVHRRTVTSAGPKWIYIGSSRYRRSDGRDERGIGNQGIQTIESFDRAQRIATARRTLQLLGLQPSSSIPPEKLEALADAVRPILDPEYLPSTDSVSKERGG